MNEDKKSKWQLLRGDGNTQPLKTEKLTALKEEFEQLGKDAGASVNDRRALAEDARFCRWPGQSPDGRKHDDVEEDGKPAFPFDGASDARVRTVDGVVQEQVIILLAALMRMNVSAKGTEATDMEKAADVSVLWRHLEKNHLGVDWFVENAKLANWRQGDSPGVAFMQVWWHEERALRPVTITPESVLRRFVETAQAQRIEILPPEAADMQDLVQNIAREEELAGLLQALWPELQPEGAAKAARTLLEEGEATFAEAYTCANQLRVKARRLFDDLFCPENTTDPKRGRIWFVREWFTEPELREKEAAGVFKRGFVDEVLKHEGQSGWKHYCHHHPITGDYSVDAVAVDWDETRQRGLYEIITAVYRGTNKHGIPGIYQVMFHHAVDVPGTDEELYNSPKGRYPFFANPREILTGKLWDARGVCELGMTEQNALKLLHDSFMDHVQLTTVPPLEVPKSRPRMALVLKPLGQVRVDRPGEIKPLNLGTYPVANDKVQAGIEARLARYFGQMTATNTPDWVRLYQQFLVDSYLVHMVEVVRYGLQLAWEYLTDEELARILGHPVQRTGDEFEYDIQISFEAGMLNLEFMKTVGEMISQYVLTWDTQSTVQRDKLVRWFFASLSPTLAQELLVPAQQAQQTEIADERNNFTLIAAGVEPPMVEAGQNFGLRLQVLLGIGEANPEAFAKLTPKSREILEARLKHLEQQVTQQQNATIGRTGARPALAPESAVEAAGLG